MKRCKPGLRYRQESSVGRVATFTAQLAEPTEKLKPRSSRRYVPATQLLVLSDSRKCVRLPGPREPGRVSPRMAQRMRKPL